MSADAAPAPIAHQVDSLDEGLFTHLEAQTTEWDKWALLALHSAVAHTLGTFSYLEIGSYLGGSLQALMRDPRCAQVTSIDTRPAAAPDARGRKSIYEGNTTAHMLELLGRVPGADMGKLSTFEHGTESLRVDQLPVRPDYCFIDGEHTDAAALRDARFCCEAIAGRGVIAFHDYTLIRPAIRAVLTEIWSDVSYAVAFTGNVFALELGGRGILRAEVVTRALRSTWHDLTWRIVNRPRKTAIPFLLAWSAIPVIDIAVAETKRRLRRTD